MTDGIVRIGLSAATVFFHAVVSTASGRAAVDDDGDRWDFFPETGTYVGKATGSIVLFGECKPKVAGNARLLFLAFPPEAIARLVQAGFVPFVSVKVDDRSVGLDVAAVVPNETVRSLWLVEAGDVGKPLVEAMASARRVSFELDGWSKGQTHVIATLVAPDAGRAASLARVATNCF